jgi:hypothetical protein
MNQWRLGFTLMCGEGVNDKLLPGLTQAPGMGSKS